MMLSYLFTLEFCLDQGINQPFIFALLWSLLIPKENTIPGILFPTFD